jgi:tetratricopeptide (TPR) repeat protein
MKIFELNIRETMRLPIRMTHRSLPHFSGVRRATFINLLAGLLLIGLASPLLAQNQNAPSEAAKQKLIEEQSAFDKGNYDEALAAYSESIKLAPQYDQAYYRRAIVLYQQRKRTESIADFTKVIEIDPTNVDAYYRRGMSYISLGVQENYDKFSADLAKSLELKPDFLLSYKARAAVNASIGKLDFAIADYSQVIRREPEKAQTYVDRGKAYFNQATPASYKLAIADMTQACRLEPKNMSAFGLRGQAHAMLGNKTAALADCDTVASLSPSGLEALASRGTVLLNLKEYAEAAAMFEKTAALAPNYGKSHLFAGIAYALLQQDDKAIPRLNTGITLSTRDDVRQVIWVLNLKARKDPADRVSSAILELLQKAAA